jgi:hypothetical protein
MATRHVHSAKEVLGDRPRYGVAVGCKRNARFNTIKDRFRQDTKKKAERGSAHFSARVSTIKPFAPTEPPQKLVCAVDEFRSICAAAMREHEPFFPTGIVLVDLERVGANLGFEERVGNRIAEKREGVMAGIVVGHGRESRRRGGQGWKEESVVAYRRRRHWGETLAVNLRRWRSG